ncbi:GxxExxY protein [Candidatus Gracilibacteria bacterium]|nr:GxxExxY protein [Candidatus Gracilibacteria bacterium]
MKFKDIDSKRQKKRKESGIYKVVEDTSKEKFYILDMFPYPSGAGLHVGHPKGYIASDSIARKKMLEGYNVLHPMGFDTFGLGTENYAIEHKMKPQDVAKKNIETYIKQMELFGTTYDRSRVVNTADPKYFKWTQSIFLKMYNHYYDEKLNKAMPITDPEKQERLAYVDYKPINRCPKCMTGLANEDLDDGKCERCASVVEQKPMKQRVLRITKYAQRLIDGLDKLNREESMKDLERNRIGKSEGTEFTMLVKITENETENFGESKKLSKENNDGSYDIIGLAMKVHKELGPGLQEKIYHKALCMLLEKNGFKVESEKKIEYKIEGEKVGYGSIDILVNGNIAIELKSRKILEGDFYKQLRTYINQSENIQTGLLINFYNGKLDYKRLEKDYIKKEKEASILGDSQDNSQLFFNVYTTRIDTVFGMSFVVMAPEHPLVDQITTDKFKKAVEKYKEEAKHKTQLERTELQKDKNGQFTGAYAINPFNGEQVPIYIADYVLANYGTGVVMAVPAHDERDFEFAKKYNLPIKKVVEPFTYYDSGDSAVQEGSPFIKRENVCVILKDPKTDKYLCLNRKNHDMRGLITGGIEEGEDIIETAKREIYEESGYKNIKFIKDPDFALHTFFWHRVKKINRHARFRYLIFELINNDRDEISEKEASVHEFVWKTKKELKTFFTVAEGEFAVNFIDNTNYVFTEKGILHDSGEFTGLKSKEAISAMQSRLEKNNLGGKKINYKMQDRVFSRQRYRGEPFPIVWTQDEKIIPLDESDLPLILPDVENYAPTGTTEGPLAAIDDRVNVILPDGTQAKRETNTMPGRAGSSRYRLRYMDPNNENALVGKEQEAYRKNVDVYIGGAEHVTRHMIYARFWQKFLYDIGIVSQDEPFQEYHYVGLIMGEDGRKMSKRRGNVVNPDEIINEFGADTLRTYEMFMGPFDQAIARSTNGIKGVKKFLDKIIALKDKLVLLDKGGAEGNEAEDLENKQTTTLLHQTIKKLTEDIDGFRFNTAVSQLMILVNHLTELEKIDRKTFETLVILVSPFAPHTAEELREQIGNEYSIFTKAKWPKYEEKYLVSNEINLAVQINGKMRGTIQVKKDIDQNQALELIKSNPKLSGYLTGEPKKIIYVQGKIINIIL